MTTPDPLKGSQKMSKKYYRLHVPDARRNDELSLALLHCNFKVHTEYEYTSFGAMPLWVCVEGEIEIKEQDKSK